VSRKAPRSRGNARKSENLLAQATGREVLSTLDETLLELPEAYRAPLILCYLEGQTSDEAGQSLGWSLETLKRRLELGGQRWRARLARRGLTLGDVLVANSLVTAEVPAALFRAAVKAGRQGAGQVRQGAPSRSIAALAEEVLKTILAPRTRTA
jgi:RNA polymerase sigma-70 factor (ECF subfamily)